DFQCPYCRRASDLEAQVRAQYGDRVRFVFRNFPLPYHKDAQLAAEASLAAGEQGKFWEMHDRMFAQQNALDRQSLEKTAGELGLDVGRFSAALDGKKFAAAVRADVDAGTSIVDGTPCMFVNGHKLTNPGLLAQAIDAELKKRNN